MKINKVLVIIAVILLICIIPIYFLFRHPKEMTNVEIISLYNNNKQIINNIKDGLLASGLNSILIYYENNQLKCREDPDGKELESIKDIHSDLIEYFTYVKKRGHTFIHLRKIDEKNKVVEFAITINKLTHRLKQVIIYTDVPHLLDFRVCIEDNWYIYRFAN